MRTHQALGMLVTMLSLSGCFPVPYPQSKELPPLAGRVFDCADKTPIQGAKVEVENVSEIAQETKADGSFQTPQAETTDYITYVCPLCIYMPPEADIEITHPLYQTLKFRVILISSMHVPSNVITEPAIGERCLWKKT